MTKCQYNGTTQAFPTKSECVEMCQFTFDLVDKLDLSLTSTMTNFLLFNMSLFE